MKIKTAYKGCSYITAGKEYDVLTIHETTNKHLCNVKDDQGWVITLRVDRPCAHLGGTGTWELMEETNED